MAGVNWLPPVFLPYGEPSLVLSCELRTIPIAVLQKRGVNQDKINRPYSTDQQIIAYLTGILH